MSGVTHLPETNFGTVTSWIPLTTAFPYQEGCSSAIIAPKDFNPSKNVELLAFDPEYGIAMDSEQICLPPIATFLWEQDLPALTVRETSTVYSLGPVVCPEAYTTATAYPVGDDREQIACCPSGYTYGDLLKAGLTRQCISPVPKGAVVTYVRPKGDGDMETATTTMASDWHVIGAAVTGVNFATSTVAATYPTLAAQDNSAMKILSARASTKKSKKKKLSGGVIGGIAAAIIVVVIILIICLVIFMLYKKKKSKAAANNPPPVELNQGQYGPGYNQGPPPSGPGYDQGQGYK